MKDDSPPIPLTSPHNSLIKSPETSEKNIPIHSEHEIHTSIIISEPCIHEPPVQKKKYSWRNFIGMLLAVLAALSFTFENFLTKVLVVDSDYDSLELLMSRGIVLTTIPTLFYLVKFLIQKGKKKNSLPIPTTEEIEESSQEKGKMLSFFHMKLLALRTICILTLDSVFAYVFLYVPVSLATVISYLFPIIAIIEARIWLKESMNKFDYIATAISFVGLLCVVEIPNLIIDGELGEDDTMYYIMLFFVLIAALALGSEIVIERKIQGKINFMFMTLSYGITLIFVYGLVCYISQFSIENTSIGPIALCSLVSISNMIAFCCQFYAVAFENAGRVGILMYSQILFTYIGDIFIFDESVGLISIIGSILIVGSSLFVTILKLRNN